MKEQVNCLELQAALQTREKLSLRYAALLATQVANEFDARLIPAVNAWINKTLTSDFSADDCSLQDIVDDTGASLFEALCMLNMQLKYPERIDEAVWVMRGDEISGIYVEQK